MEGLSFNNNNNMYTFWELMVEVKIQKKQKKYIYILYNLSKNVKL